MIVLSSAVQEANEDVAAAIRWTIRASFLQN